MALEGRLFNSMNFELKLRQELTNIKPADRDAMAQAAVYQGTLAKPPGSLGELETISIRLSGITGYLRNEVTPCRIIVLCADNGVVQEGVSVTPQSVTAVQAVNMTHHLTGMSSMAHHFGDDVQVVDVGIASPYDCPAVLNCRIRPGTGNLYREPAMKREEAAQAICIGFELARKAKEDGIRCVGVGEMGIGNTTTSAAVLAALTGLSPEKVTGRGGGMTDEGFALKKRVIAQALALHRPDPADVLDVLRKVGGLDLAAMCGVFLGAASVRLPAVIDGFISVVAALCAKQLCPHAVDYLFASHASREIGYMAALKELGLTPALHLGMRLGEGSGCPIAFRVLEAACAAMNGMATFDGAAIDDGYLDKIRGKDCF